MGDDWVGYYHCGRVRAELDLSQATSDELASWLEATVRGAEQGISTILRWLKVQRRPDNPLYLVLLEASIYPDRPDALAYRDGAGWVQEGDGTQLTFAMARLIQDEQLPNKTRLEEVW